MLTLQPLPLPNVPVPAFVLKLDRALSDAGDHADAERVQRVLDTLQETLATLGRIAAECESRPMQSAMVDLLDAFEVCGEDGTAEICCVLDAWDLGREDRAHRNSLDWQRMVREA